MATKTNTKATEITQLLPPLCRKTRNISYSRIFCLMLNRSLNAAWHRSFAVFSWYFSSYFGVNYTLFAVTLLDIGSLLNLLLLQYYKSCNVRWVILVFELLLSACTLVIVPWHSFIGLFLMRLLITLAITGIRLQVNTIVAVFTHAPRRRKASVIMEMPFALSGVWMIAIGATLHYFGDRRFLIAACVLIAIMAALMAIAVPSYHVSEKRKQTHAQHCEYISLSQIADALKHKRLKLCFIIIALNKIARNAFLYTLSKWLVVEYALSALQIGYVYAACIAVASSFGATFVSWIVAKCHGQINIHLLCLLSSLMQIMVMLIEPAWHIVMGGHSLPLYAAICVIFAYFCACQILNNNVLDIMIGVTPHAKLLPAVHTIRMVTTSFGGFFGTISSTVWYDWASHVGIAVVCAVLNVAVLCIVVLLWIIANKTITKSSRRRAFAKTRTSVPVASTPIEGAANNQQASDGEI